MMRIKLAAAFGALALAGMLIAWPSISAAAVAPAAPVLPAATAGQTPATPAPTDNTSQVTQACLAAHNQPTADQRVAAMTQLMNDPNTIAAMRTMMGGSAGSMMSGWTGQNGGK